VSAETVRALTGTAGREEAAWQAALAREQVSPTAEQVRTERAQEGVRAARDAPPERLLVGLDGGWMPSRDQAEGMEGKVGVVASLRPPAPAEPIERLEQTLHYLQAQRDWIGNYQAWQEADLPIGSGLVERAVELVLNRRLKRRGMRWRRTNADAVTALRVLRLNGDWERRAPLLPLVASLGFW
jgi:hypothetical protein